MEQKQNYVTNYNYNNIIHVLINVNTQCAEIQLYVDKHSYYMLKFTKTI